MALSLVRSKIRLGRLILLLGIVVGGVPARAQVAQPAATATQSLPTQISDAEFWGMVSGMSEAGGFFQSDNFVSNERSFPAIVNALRASWKPGGVYIGVGPEQNFAYIAALRPKMVFLLDIRRQMIVHQLMYKAIFELSPDRADFVSMLFSKPRPPGLSATSTVHEIWRAFEAVPSDATLYEKNLTAVRNHLTKTRGFALPDGDQAALIYVYGSFYDLGPAITYSGHTQRGPGTAYSSITQETDANGEARSFLATEDNFQFIRGLHQKNLIVPVVADFGGPTGIRAVGSYLKGRGATVTAFYTSNVEQYLFRDPGAPQRFYANIASLPLDSMSTFIRPAIGGGSGAMVTMRGTYTRFTVLNGVATVDTIFSPPPPLPPNVATSPSATIRRGELCPILAFLKSHAEGRIFSYDDARSCRL